MAAVNAASTGDEIIIKPGTYVEAVYLNRTLNLTGEGWDCIIKSPSQYLNAVFVNCHDCNITKLTITGVPTNTDTAGVKIHGRNTTVTDCNISDNGRHGVWIDGLSAPRPVRNNTVENCTFNGNLDPVYIASSNLNNVIDCDMNCTGDFGMYIHYSDHTTIIGNDIYNTTDYALLVHYTEDLYMRDNTMDINGLEIDGWIRDEWDSHDIDTSNSVGGLPLYYFVEVYGLVVPHDSHQIIVVNCTNAVAQGHTFSGSEPGLQMAFCQDGNVNDLTVSDRYMGFVLYSCDRMNVTGANIHNNTYGLRLTYSTRCNIMDNYIHDNTDIGLWVYYSDNAMIVGNDISDNGDIGLFLSYSNSARAYNNTIQDNGGFGVTIPSWNNHWIYHNIITGNNGVGAEAKDDYLGNHWDDGTYGNYWDNWHIPDNNNDGIVDYEYDLIGSSNAVDNYPLVVPFGWPLIVTDDVSTAHEEVLYMVQYDAIDFDTDNSTLVWSWDTNADWLDFDSSQVLYGMPYDSDIGSFWVEITVTDGDHQDVTNFTVSVGNTNDDPVIHTTNVLYIDEDKEYAVNYTALDPDPDGDQQTWTLETNCTFLDLSADGNLTGNPENEDVGYWLVNVTVTDAHGATDSSIFDLQVRNVNDAPEIVTSKTGITYEDELYLVDYNATDIDPTHDTLTWHLYGDADFLSIDSATGVLSGTPDHTWVGTWTVNVSVVDGNGGEDYLVYSLEVREVFEPIVINPVLTNLTIQEDEVGYIPDVSRFFTAPDGEELFFMVSGPESFKNVILENGSAEIAPREDLNGEWTITLEATSDWLIIATHYIHVTVVGVNDAPYDASIHISSAEIYDNVNVDLSGSASDVDKRYGDTLTYTWSSDVDGPLGTGESIDTFLTAGPHNITLTVTDSAMATTTAYLEVTVTEYIEPNGTTDGPEPDGRDGGDDDPFDITVMILAGILVVAIILVAISIAFVVFGKKPSKQPEPEAPPEETSVAEEEFLAAEQEEGELPDEEELPEEEPEEFGDQDIPDERELEPDDVEGELPEEPEEELEELEEMKELDGLEDDFDTEDEDLDVMLPDDVD